MERQTQQEVSNQTDNCKTFDSGDLNFFSRWITIATALSNTPLREIPCDPRLLESNATLFNLKQGAPRELPTDD